MSSKYTTCFFCAQTMETSSQTKSTRKKFQLTNQQVNCLKILLTYLTGGGQSIGCPSSKLNRILKLWTSSFYLLEASGNIYNAKLCMDCNAGVQKFIKLQLELEYVRRKITNSVKTMQGIIVSSKFKSADSIDKNIRDAMNEFQEAVCCSVNTTNLKANFLEALTIQPEVQLCDSTIITISDEPEDVDSLPNSPVITIADVTQDNIDYNSLSDDNIDTIDFTEHPPPPIVTKVIPVQNPIPVIQRRYCCGQCQDDQGNHKAFETESGLRQHIEDHHRPKSFKCQVCGATFGQRYILHAHQRIHTGDGFKCGTCGKSFAYKSQCNYHERYVHSQEKTLVCKLCGKTFRSPRSLNEHKLAHTDERKFECHLCKWKFKTKKVLLSHLRAHSGERKFTCDVCGFRLTTKWSMENHRRIKHPEAAINTADVTLS